MIAGGSGILFTDDDKLRKSTILHRFGLHIIHPGAGRALSAPCQKLLQLLLGTTGPYYNMPFFAVLHFTRDAGLLRHALGSSPEEYTLYLSLYDDMKRWHGVKVKLL